MFKELREKNTNGVKLVAQDIEEDNTSSVMFTATFHESLRTSVCVDPGSDAPIMDEDTLQKMEAAEVSMKVASLPNVRSFDMAVASVDDMRPRINCDRVATIDTEIHIKHGSALVVRRM